MTIGSAPIEIIAVLVNEPGSHQPRPVRFGNQPCLSGELLLDPARELVCAEGQGADVFVVRGEHDALGIGGERQGPAAADFDELT